MAFSTRVVLFSLFGMGKRAPAAVIGSTTVDDNLFVNHKNMLGSRGQHDENRFILSDGKTLTKLQ